MGAGCADGAGPFSPVTPSPEPHAAFTHSAEDLAGACEGCHPAEAAAWLRSQHARASVAVHPGEAAPLGGLTGPAVAWIGVAPLRQALVRAEGGRLVVADAAVDTRDGSFFTLTGATPGEVVHDRSSTWDTQCASCHMTGLRVGYDAATDRYATTAAASGVACQACHLDHGAGSSPARSHADTTACEDCHARREPLVGEPALSAARSLTTGAVIPFTDRARLELVDTPELFHADGQAADEVFEVGSLALSAMGAAGVTCNDCHEPHGGGLRRPVTDDSLCLGCHAVTAKAPLAARAPDIVPNAHTHHAPGNEGARCVSCHMPARTYMQRDRRRDHGFTVPDPALAARVGAPDACTDCHAGRTQAQAAAEVARWWPEMVRTRAHVRQRAEAVHLMRRDDPTASTVLLAALDGEANPAWEASLLGLLATQTDALSPEVLRRAALGLRSPTPAVRAASARVLARDPSAASLLTALRAQDPSRLVRLAAAWATRASLPAQGPLRDEVEEWLAASADQPAGARRIAGLRRAEGHTAEAAVWVERARTWESPPTGVPQARSP